MNKIIKNILITIAIIIGIIFAFKAIAIVISESLSLASKTIGDAYGTDCEKTQNWTVGKYELQEYECIGWAGPHYYPISLSENDKVITESGYKIDSCEIHFHPKKNLFLTINICNKKITELRPEKEMLNFLMIDSVYFYSKERNQYKKLSPLQISRLTDDWNKSKIRGYTDKPFDSAFSYNIAFQYKITIYSKNNQRLFYGYNYLMLDDSSWEYEMSETGDIDYIHKYWKE